MERFEVNFWCRASTKRSRRAAVPFEKKREPLEQAHRYPVLLLRNCCHSFGEPCCDVRCTSSGTMWAGQRRQRRHPPTVTARGVGTAPRSTLGPGGVTVTGAVPPSPCRATDQSRRGDRRPAPLGPIPGRATMAPQPELARHRGFRRLVVNGVKCMSNYSELSSIYHEHGNIFPASCTNSFRVTEVESQNFETITGNKFAAHEKCRPIDIQKLNP